MKTTRFYIIMIPLTILLIAGLIFVWNENLAAWDVRDEALAVQTRIQDDMAALDQGTLLLEEQAREQEERLAELELQTEQKKKDNGLLLERYDEIEKWNEEITQYLDRGM